MKAPLRSQYKALRRALPAAERQRRSEQLCKLFFRDVFSEKIKWVHVFLPIKKLHEIDTFLIINRLRQNFPETAIYTSVADFEGNEMNVVPLRPDALLQENAFGIPEPTDTPPEAHFPPGGSGLVLVPLLAFDGHGHRLGYGKGFYDRFLARLPPAVWRVGLSFFPPTATALPADLHDVPLHACLTPTETLFFNPPGGGPAGF